MCAVRKSNVPPIGLIRPRWVEQDHSNTTVARQVQRSQHDALWHVGMDLAELSASRSLEAPGDLAIGADLCALLTGDLDLWVVGTGGQVVDRKGPLPTAWRLTSNLFATDTGWVHFGLGAVVAGYRLVN